MSVKVVRIEQKQDYWSLLYHDELPEKEYDDLEYIGSGFVLFKGDNVAGEFKYFGEIAILTTEVKGEKRFYANYQAILDHKLVVKKMLSSKGF